jgi:hypothetical protein
MVFIWMISLDLSTLIITWHIERSENVCPNQHKKNGVINETLVYNGPLERI